MKRALKIAAAILAVAIVGYSSYTTVNQVVSNTEDISEAQRAVTVSCRLLNQAIDQSAEGAAGRSTALLIAEILEGMTPAEAAAYEKAAANGANEGPQRNPCRRVARQAYAD